MGCLTLDSWYLGKALNKNCPVIRAFWLWFLCINMCILQTMLLAQRLKKVGGLQPRRLSILSVHQHTWEGTCSNNAAHDVHFPTGCVKTPLSNAISCPKEHVLDTLYLPGPVEQRQLLEFDPESCAIAYCCRVNVYTCVHLCKLKNDVWNLSEVDA